MSLKQKFLGLIAGAALFLAPVHAFAANYLTAVGVQQFSVTIASGATTGTATISPVGSGAFIVYQGQNSTDATGTSGLANFTISGTTITATRHVSAATTITAKGAIVDGDTTNLIKSVQFGTITIPSGASGAQASVTISGVTNTNTAVEYLGVNSNAGANYERTFPTLKLSGTTLTASLFASNGQIVVSYGVYEFQPGALNSSTQNFSINSPASGTTNTGTISSVTTANTMLFFGGFLAGVSASDSTKDLATVELISSTQVQIGFSSAPATSANTYAGTVVEFASGVLAQSAQRGLVSALAATTKAQTITSAATANTVCNFLNNTAQAGTFSPTNNLPAITQTAATTLTTTMNTLATWSASWEAITFQPFIAGGTTDAIWFGEPF